VLEEKSRLGITDADNFIIFGEINLTKEEKVCLNLPAKFGEYDEISGRDENPSTER
jgi:hypothetical protein